MGDMGGFSSFFESIFGGMGGGRGFSSQGFPGGGGVNYEDLFGAAANRGAGSRGRQTSAHAGTQRAAEPVNVEEDLYLDLEEVATGVKKEVVTPSGKRLTVNIPKGVKEGAKIRLAGENGQRVQGDLLLVVRYRKHSKFQVDGENLIYEAPVSVPELVLGTEIRVPMLSGELSMKIPAGTQPGRLMRLKGQGLPCKNGDTSGDLLVRPKAVIPEHPSAREKELYEELRALHHPHA
jgi:curved DNA-binding protein